MAATYSPVDLSNFAKRNIFSLIEEPKPEPVALPNPKKIGAPQLQSISTLYSPPKAVLRMSKAGGGKARSVFLGPKESKDGVEVISVDVATSTVVVKVGEHTYALKIGTPKLASKPILGRENRSPDAPRTTGSSRPGSSGSRHSTPLRKPGGLNPVPAGAFTNTLGMKFVPVPGTKVQFCIWETRVKGYAGYTAANAGVDAEQKTLGA